MSRPAASSRSAWVDGPNASRSASRIRLSSSGTRSNANAGSCGRHEVVDEADGELPRLDPHLLLAVLVDHVVATVLAGSSGLALAHVRAGQVLELERDVLRHVAGPGALPEARDEPAAAAQAAGVVLERGQHLDQRVHEAGDRVGGELLQDAQVHDLADHRRPHPVAGASQDAGLQDAKRGFRAGLARSVRGATLGGRRLGARRRGPPRPLRGCGVRLRHLGPSSPARAWEPECTRRVARRGAGPAARPAARPGDLRRAAWSGRARRGCRPAGAPSTSRVWSSPAWERPGEPGRGAWRPRQLEATSPPSMAWSIGAATRVRRRRSKR